MLKRLKLTGFKQHEDRVIEFTSGLQALRGRNEVGKSGIFHAIAYAFFGSRALPLSLEDTVTWGRPVSALRVELDFIHEGKKFNIVRKKSGAELTGEGFTASGQAEVTAFIEHLFGASATVAMATMLANQNSLQAGLNSSSMPLIEKLANMSLIDDLIGKVQEKLPSGNTKGLEAQLHTFSELSEPVLDISNLELTKANAETTLEETKAKLAHAQEELKAVMPLVESRKKKLQDNKSAESVKSTLQSQIESLTKKLVVPDFTPPNVEELKVLLSNQTNQVAINTAYAKFCELQVQFIPSVATEKLEEDTQRLQSGIKLATQELNEAKLELAKRKAMLITESACGLCGKDLTEVPEVVTKNAQTQAFITELELVAASRSKAIKEISDELEALARYSKDQTSLAKKLPIPYVEVDNSFTPSKLKWTGPQAQEASTEDYKGQLATAELAIKQHAALVSAAEAAKSQIEDISARLATIQLQQVSPEEEAAVTQAESLAKTVSFLKDRLAEQLNIVSTLANNISTAKAVYEANLSNYRQGIEQKEKLLQLLVEYNFNNGIVQKLREARPAVAAKLWALVLAGVSHYFSQIRGTQSTVTRGENGFLIDGKGVDAFSGSAKDSLGLSIRIMLQKTFLPNTGFMLVDEPGAACDDVRESDMLAALSSCGLEQVILVTHSDLADTFAANVIQL